MTMCWCAEAELRAAAGHNCLPQLVCMHLDNRQSQGPTSCIWALHYVDQLGACVDGAHIARRFQQVAQSYSLLDIEALSEPLLVDHISIWLCCSIQLLPQMCVDFFCALIWGRCL
jgi:hypothetical protein